MKELFTDLELFDQYMYQEMSEEENLEFEERLNSNPSFKSEFETYKVLTIGIQRFNERDMRTQIRKIINLKTTTFLSPKNYFTMKKYPFTQLAAAAVVALCMFTGVYYFYLKDNGPEELLTEFRLVEKEQMRVYMNELTAPGMAFKDKGKFDTIRDAVQFFSQGEFSSSAKAFDDFVRNYPNDEMVPVANFYLGRILMGNEDYSKAIKKFESVIYLDGFEFQDLAQFNMAQCLLLYDSKGAKEIALKLLAKVVANPNSKITKNAKAFMDMIR